MLNQTEQIANYLGFLKADEKDHFLKMEIQELLYCLVELKGNKKVALPCDLSSINWNDYFNQELHEMIFKLSMFELKHLFNKATEKEYQEFYQSL